MWLCLAIPPGKVKDENDSRIIDEESEQERTTSDEGEVTTEQTSS